MTCPHIRIDDVLERRIKYIDAIVQEYKHKRVSMVCNYCPNIRPVFICIECGVLICNVHLESKTPHVENHNIYYNIFDKDIYCACCETKIDLHDKERPDSLSTTSTTDSYNTYILKGIPNTGHTDNISTILQTVLVAKQVRDYYFTTPHPCTGNDRDFCPECFFKKIYKQVYSESSINPCDAIMHLWNKNPLLTTAKKADIEEAYKTIVNLYHADSSPHHGRCECPLHSIFFGKRTVELECMQCRHITRRTAEFSHLNLQCTFSLADAVQTNMLEGDYSEVLPCKNCFTGTLQQRKSVILEFPHILALHFQRFTNLKSNRKNTCKILINNLLSLQGKMYKIYGFIEHRGSLPGHYVLYLLLKDEWYEFDDEKIIKDVNVTYKITNALMVFYLLQ